MSLDNLGEIGRLRFKREIRIRRFEFRIVLVNQGKRLGFYKVDAWSSLIQELTKLVVKVSRKSEYKGSSFETSFERKTLRG